MHNLITFFIVPFLIDFSLSGAGIVINFRAQDLNANAFDLGLLGFAWGLPYMIGCIVVGRIADHYSRKKLMLCGLIGNIISIFLLQWMPSPHFLALANIGTGLSSSFFWPVFETLISHDDKERANKRLGAFNLGWTLGIGCGLGAGGFLSQLGIHQALNILAGLISVALFIFLKETRSGIEPLSHPSPEELTPDERSTPAAVRMTYLYIAWIANFSLWFTAGAVSSLFPKLCRILLIPDHTSGVLIGLIMFSQAVAFYAISRTTSWHFRLAPMLFFQVLAIAGSALLAYGQNVSVFLIAMLLMGCGRGLTYCCSLYYGIAAESGKGANAGIHEMLIGLACALGPLACGKLAELRDLPSAFLFCALLGLGLVVVEILLWKRDDRSICVAHSQKPMPF